MLAATLVTLALLAPQTPKETKEQKAERQHQEDLKHDIELGAKYAVDADKEYKPSEDKAIVERVQRIGKVLADIANKTPVEVRWGDKRLNPFPYTFKVIQGKDVNAFSIPGGNVYVFEGLVKESESDDELAGVLAHEISHAEQRHVATLQREQSKMQNITLPLVLLAILTGGVSAAASTMGVGSLVMQATGSGWSVKAEESADYGGFQYMRKSPYDPTGMLTFMERLARKNMLADNIDWGIYKSHPPSRERAKTLTDYMNAAHVPIRRSRVAASYRTTVKDTVDGAVALVFGGKTLTTFAGPDAKTRADAAAERVNVFFDASPALFELKPGPDGAILGANRPLFSVTATDSALQNQTLQERQSETIKAMQLALYTTGGKVWSSN